MRELESTVLSIGASIVIPTFPRPELLRRAITSVLAQEGVGVELIVVDYSVEGSAADVATERGEVEYCVPKVLSRVLLTPNAAVLR